jgi:hypothetical protein
MAYTINLTDGSIFATIPDGTTNTASSVTLVGKNYAGYGLFLDENFIQMLENFSNSTSPTSPLTGQLWWDKTNGLLKVYNGTTFKTISAATASASAPSSNVTGDLWYDTTNQQVKVWTGAAFLVVGPAYTSSTGTAGAIPETINDNTATPHYVTTIYVNNVRTAIYNNDTTFTAAAPVSSLFPTVYKGMTMSNASGTNISGNLIGAGNVVVNSAGANVALFTNTGVNVAGYANASGNVIGGNVLTSGAVSATGNITAANFIGNVIPPAGGAVSTTGNITGGNILTGGLISATSTITSAANITGGNVLTVGLVSATGNVYGANFVGNVVSPAGSNVSTTGNITGGNILTGGLVSATGNITGSYLLGNGSQLTGISAAVSVSQIQNGTSNASIGTSGGNLSIGIGGTANVVVIDTTTIYTNVVSAQSIAHTGTNAVGNIGSSSSYFNRLFATATTALYADVAERFAADEVLEAGTVVELGGTQEITRSVTELSENVFGVISTRAAYLMNGGAGEDDTHPPVAMTGRVPVKVIGVIHKGDRLVSAGSGIARAAKPGEATSFNVIGRSLVDKLTPESGTIEAIVTIKN